MTTKAETSEQQTAPIRYRVVAACATCLVPAMAGFLPGRSAATGVIQTFYRGSILPVDAPAETVQRLLRKGAVEEVPQ